MADSTSTSSSSAKASDTTKAEPAKSEPAKSRHAKGDLAPAGQSGDPTVQKLLAERQGHVSNMSPDDPEVALRRKAAQEAIDGIDEKLADLGYAAQ